MTEEDFRRALARIAELESRVESLRREVASAGDAETGDADADDFGGGGEPSWEGAMGRVPDGMVENPAIPPLPDTTAAKDPNALQYKSLDDRKDSPPPGVTQIHDFDESPLSNTRRIELKAVTTTGTGGGRKLQLVDPDGNADFRTKWMIPLREAGTGGREIKWACIGGEACLPVPTFTASVAPGTGTPGVVVTPGGTECAPTVDLAFSGLQGAKGDKGDKGEKGDDGCSPTVTPCAEPYVHGDCAATITPCGEGATPITVYNGKNGADGCSPTVTAGSTPSVHGDLACTITPCGEGATPISVYHGRNGTDGADGAPGSVCGSFVANSGVEISTGTGGSQWLKFNLVTYTFQKRTGSDCYEPVAGADNWVEVLEFRSC